MLKAINFYIQAKRQPIFKHIRRWTLSDTINLIKVSRKYREWKIDFCPCGLWIYNDSGEYHAINMNTWEPVV